MPYTIIIHPTGEEPIIGEIEELPKPTDLSITLNVPVGWMEKSCIT